MAPRAVAHLALLASLLILPLAHAASLLHLSRATSISDIIGSYGLDDQEVTLPSQEGCPVNLTTNSFNFLTTNAPSSLRGIERFHIKIPHVVQKASGRQCESSGAVLAARSSHPFILNRSQVIDSWATAGGGRRASWISTRFTDMLKRPTTVWNYGHDFVERSCRGVRIPAGAGYLWFQPAWDVALIDEEETASGNPGIMLTARTRYLILTFWNQPKIGCVFKAISVGGEGGLSLGPVSDPSLDVLGASPEPPAPPPASSDSSADETPDDDGSPEPTEDVDTATPLPDAPTPAPPAPSPTPSPRPASVFDTGQDDASSGAFPEDDDEGACFPASATVRTSTGEAIRMDELRVGHRVLVAEREHSDVFFFSHRQQKTMYDFVRLSTEGGHVLTISAEHYVHSDGRLVAAKTVRVGDNLQTGSGLRVAVTAVQHVREVGLYAPHTLHGDIVVDGLRVSTYTQTVHPRVAHHLLAPVRLLYRLGLAGLVDGMLDQGSNTLARFVTSGPDVL